MNELKSWADLANAYPMILFNNAINLEDGKIFEEWQENHQCEAKDAQYHIDTCEVKDCKHCAELKQEYGDYPECSCEPYQWYAIDVSELEAEKLNEDYNLDIFYSDTLGLYLMPVYHFGTSWRIMGLKGGYVNI